VDPSNPKLATLSNWLVYRLGGQKAALLGTVMAHNRETALAKAYDEFAVAPAERKRIVAWRMSDDA
jgi:hypothetical protein